MTRCGVDGSVLRCACVYAAGFFAVEYSSGWLFRRVTGRAPWDYSAHRRNLHGLITPDYFPVWAAFGLALEPVHDALTGVRRRRREALDSGWRLPYRPARRMSPPAGVRGCG